MPPQKPLLVMRTGVSTPFVNKQGSHSRYIACRTAAISLINEERDDPATAVSNMLVGCCFSKNRDLHRDLRADV